MVVPVGTVASARASASAAAASGAQVDTSGYHVAADTSGHEAAASLDRTRCCPASDASLTDASYAVLWLLARSARF